jgi:hypothetical protein
MFKLVEERVPDNFFELPEPKIPLELIFLYPELGLLYLES